MNDLDTKDIYLTKDGEIVGLHAVGYKEPGQLTVYNLDGTTFTISTDFVEHEKWGNEYDSNFKAIGRGSFRVFELTLEHAAKGLEEDGWVRIPGPKNV